MICSRCGWPSDEMARFCGQCGALMPGARGVAMRAGQFTTFEAEGEEWPAMFVSDHPLRVVVFFPDRYARVYDYEETDG